MIGQSVAPFTPYEQMVAAKRAGRTTAETKVGRPRVLSDAQRAARKKADSIAGYRAIQMLRERHREEYNALRTAEANALYARIDAAYAAGLEIVLP